MSVIPFQFSHIIHKSVNCVYYEMFHKYDMITGKPIRIIYYTHYNTYYVLVEK